MNSTQDEHFPETVLGAWRRIHRIRQADMAKALGVSQQQAQRYCLPRQHHNHNRPGPEVSDKLRIWTGGALHAGNFSDPYDPTQPLPPAPSSEGGDGAMLNTGVAKADAVPTDIQ